MAINLNPNKIGDVYFVLIGDKHIRGEIIGIDESKYVIYWADGVTTLEKDLTAISRSEMVKIVRKYLKKRSVKKK